MGIQTVLCFTMRCATIAAIFATASVGRAQAAVVLFDNFNTENNALAASNYADFANFEIERGSVNLMGPNDTGFTTGDGMYIGLDGVQEETGNGPLLNSRSFFSFSAGDVVKLSFYASGNQRTSIPSGANEIYGGFDFDKQVLYNWTLSGGAMRDIGGSPDFSFSSGFGASTPVAWNNEWTYYSIQFTAGEAGYVRAKLGGTATAGFGPLLDDIELSIGPPPVVEPPVIVPEPAIWGMMLVGFGGIGIAMRGSRPQRAYCRA